MNSSKEITFRTKQIHKRPFFISANLFFLRRDEKPSFVYLCIRIRAKEITALGLMFLRCALGTFFGTRTDDSKTQLRSFRGKKGRKSPIFFQLGSFFPAYTMPKRWKGKDEVRVRFNYLTRASSEEAAICSRARVRHHRIFCGTHLARDRQTVPPSD